MKNSVQLSWKDDCVPSFFFHRPWNITAFSSSTESFSKLFQMIFRLRLPLHREISERMGELRSRSPHSFTMTGYRFKLSHPWILVLPPPYLLRNQCSWMNKVSLTEIPLHPPMIDRYGNFNSQIESLPTRTDSGTKDSKTEKSCRLSLGIVV